MGIYFALNTASYLIKAKTKKITGQQVPMVLSDLNVPIYELPEKVIDVASLVEVLSEPYKEDICIGSIDSLSRDGKIIFSGNEVNAQVVICVAGLGNEKFLRQLEVGGNIKRRPLRQLMVKQCTSTLWTRNHNKLQTSVTITSHPLPLEVMWYRWAMLIRHYLMTAIFAKKK